MSTSFHKLYHLIIVYIHGTYGSCRFRRSSRIKVSEEKEPGRGLSHSRFGAALTQSATRRKGHSPASCYIHTTTPGSSVLNLIPPYFSLGRSGSTRCHWCLFRAALPIPRQFWSSDGSNSSIFLIANILLIVNQFISQIVSILHT